MSRGQPCNHCGFEKPYHFLACVCSTAFLFLSNNPSSLITQIASQKKKKGTKYELQTHKRKGTKPRN